MTAMRKEPWILALAVLLWAGSVALGMKVLSTYESTPGQEAMPSSHWPAASTLRPSEDRFTLVMLAHPHCPCTRASLTELNVLMNRLQGRLSAQILFVKPREFPDDWARTDSWSRALEIPGASVRLDLDGMEASRFHAQTSGQTFVYDPAGRLRFSGGITSARGREGDSEARRDVFSLVLTGRTPASAEKVFGCPLFDARESQPKGGGP